jgi:predicted nucleotidyltransferase
MVFDKDDNALIDAIRHSIPDLIALYRFGSRAKGTPRPGSDIDLAALARDPVPNIRRFELAQELAT